MSPVPSLRVHFRWLFVDDTADLDEKRNDGFGLKHGGSGNGMGNEYEWTTLDSQLGL